MGIFDDARSEYEREKAMQDAETARRLAEWQERTEVINRLAEEFATFAAAEQFPMVEFNANSQNYAVWLVRIENEQSSVGIHKDGTWTPVNYSGQTYGIGLLDRVLRDEAGIERDFKAAAKELLAKRDGQRM